MTRLRSPFAALRDSRGVLAIESVLVAPLLILMALGVFQAGSMVSRQQELQSGASDITAIILASASSSAGASSNDIKTIVKETLNLTDSQVTLVQRFRCGAATALVADQSTCPTGSQVYEYVLLGLTDTYTPVWAQYGVGAPVTFTVNRTIQIK